MYYTHSKAKRGIVRFANITEGKMQSVTIISVGKQGDVYKNAANEYIKRLAAYCKVNAVELQQVQINEKNAGSAEIEKALEKEAQLIINSLPKNCIIVALCIEGSLISSEEFAHFFKKKADEGASHIAFIIGSSFGIANSLKQKAHLKLSMSKMTFPHKLARCMLLEQVYRAYCILAKSKYHK